MLKSYWKTAVRSLLRNKTYGFINIIGLAAKSIRHPARPLRKRLL